MPLSQFNTTTPLNTDLEGNGALRIREQSVAIKERIELDHQFGESLDPTNPKCDGYHKKVTMPVLSSDPTLLTGAGILYTKTVDGTQGLYFRNSAGIVRII